MIGSAKLAFFVSFLIFDTPSQFDIFSVDVGTGEGFSSRGCHRTVGNIFDTIVSRQRDQNELRNMHKITSRNSKLCEGTFPAFEEVIFILVPYLN